MTMTLITLQITIVTYGICGWILQKTGMITSEGQIFLSDFILGFLLPVSVFVSFYTNITAEILKDLAAVLLAAIVFEAAIFLLIRFDHAFTDEQRSVAHYSWLVSNGGLIGTPVIEGLFGSAGDMICNVFLIPTRIMAFAVGESVFQPSTKKGIRETVISVLTNRIILAIAAAAVLKFTGIPLPQAILTALTNIGKCMSPLSLILVGSMLGEKVSVSAKSLKSIAVISLVRLAVIPLAALCVCRLMGMDFMTCAIIALLLGMPAGSTTAVFARKYDGDTAFASMTVMITTLLSTVSLVVVLKITELFFL